MINLDEDALICDFAETYHILDYRRLPLRLVAVLACGLRDDSRIKLKASNRKLTLLESLSAATVDKLTQLLWTKTKDAEKGRNAPKSILEMLENPPEVKHKTFSSVEMFERRREQLMRS